jgi:Mn2+/Fe2+ NRAMP family transporter
MCVSVPAAACRSLVAVSLLQVCREAYPPLVCGLLWLLCEISIVALDLTMVLGEL